MIRVPAPAQLVGRTLAREIEQTVGAPTGTVSVTVVGDQVEVDGVPEQSTDVARQAIAAHTGTAPAEIQRRENLRGFLDTLVAQLEAATTSATTWRALSADQKDDLQRRSVMGLAAAARLLLARYDTA